MDNKHSQELKQGSEKGVCCNEKKLHKELWWQTGFSQMQNNKTSRRSPVLYARRIGSSFIFILLGPYCPVLSRTVPSYPVLSRPAPYRPACCGRKVSPLLYKKDWVRLKRIAEQVFSHFCHKKANTSFFSCIERSFSVTFLEIYLITFGYFYNNKIFVIQCVRAYSWDNCSRKAKCFLDIRFRKTSFFYEKKWRNYFRGNPSVNH